MNEISRMMYADVRAELDKVWEAAKPYIAPRCRACKICNGFNCKRVASEKALTAQRNYAKLQQIKILYDTI